MSHLITLVLFVAAVAAMCWTGRALRRTRAGRRYEIALSLSVWALWFGYQAYDIITKGFQATHAFPLQLSDVTAAVAGLVFIWPHRNLQALAYFLGLAIGSQAVFTPDLVSAPDTFEFWAFWIYHLFVVGAGIYALTVQGFRPEWRDLRFALLFGLAYVAIVFTIDAIFDLNYGYLGRGMPARPSLLDVLGPWPLRVVFMVLLGSTVMTLLWLPWLWLKLGSTRRAYERPSTRA